MNKENLNSKNLTIIANQPLYPYALEPQPFAITFTQVT